MILDTEYFNKHINTLDKAFLFLQNAQKNDIEYDMYRSACIKELEIILEQSGKLLKKVLKPYFHSSLAVDSLYFKDIFRQAVHKGIIDTQLCEHFLEYRDKRNTTAHDYGVNFAEDTLTYLPRFIEDSKKLLEALNNNYNAHKE